MNTRNAIASPLVLAACLLAASCTSEMSVRAPGAPGVLATPAKASAPGTASAAQAEDEVELLSLVQASAVAWNRGDLKGHLAIYDDSVTVMTKDGPRPTRAALEKAFAATYFVDGKPKQNLRLVSARVRFLSDTSALMTGRFILSGGELPENSGWFTLVWIKTAAGWRAVHDHSS